MRIVHISDTHNRHRQLTKLPEGEVIVHSGDFTMAGTEAEAGGAAEAGIEAGAAAGVAVSLSQAATAPAARPCPADRRSRSRAAMSSSFER